MILELRYISYEERLKECCLTTLETTRIRGEQIEVFMILPILSLRYTCMCRTNAPVFDHFDHSLSEENFLIFSLSSKRKFPNENVPPGLTLHL